jgi:hypothetical protein
MRISCFAAVLIAMVATPSKACEIDTPTDWLPGFTKEHVEERSYEILRAGTHIRQYARIESMMSRAHTIYLARVEKSDQNVDNFNFSTTLETLKPIKGKVTGRRTLRGTSPDSCGNAYGDGDGAYAKVGELVVVFEGVETDETRPRGIDSVRMIEVHYGSLLDPVQEWLQSQPEYGAVK